MAISNNASGYRPGVCTYPTRPTAPYRTCTKCLVEKELTEFYKDVRGRFGTMSKCKKCHNKIVGDRRIANPKPHNNAAAKWRKNNKDKIKIINAATKSRRRKSERKQVTKKDWLSVLRRYNNCCAYCGVGGEMTMDHVVPLIRGGRHSIGNIIPSCLSCNSSKNRKFIVEWRNK